MNHLDNLITLLNEGVTFYKACAHLKISRSNVKRRLNKNDRRKLEETILINKIVRSTAPIDETYIIKKFHQC